MENLKTNWSKEFDKEFKPRNVGGSISIERYLGLLKGQKAFFRQKFKEAFEEIKEMIKSGCPTEFSNKLNEIKEKYI